MDQQHTFGEKVGLPPTLPPAHLPCDNVKCHLTGETLDRCDSFRSHDGKCFSDDEDRKEYDLGALREFFDEVLEWSTLHHESDDVAESYAHCAGESDQMNDNIEIWLNEEYEIEPTYKLIQDMSYTLIKQMDVEIVPEYRNSHLDVVFDCFECGEVEEQVDIDREPLRAMHENGTLNDLLDELDRDYCFFRYRTWNPETKTWVQGNIVRSEKHPTITLYHCVGVWYYFGCSADTAREAYEECIGE